MARCEADRDSKKKPGMLNSYSMRAVRIYKGTFVFVHCEDGLAHNHGDITSDNNMFVGVAFIGVDNSHGVAGGASVIVESEGVYEFLAEDATQKWVGQAVYAVDDQTVTTDMFVDDEFAVHVGYVTEFVDSRTVRVRIDNAVC